jgi:hypothetical protein
MTMGWDLSSIIELTNDIRAKAVAIFDANGVQLSGFDPSRPANAAITSVASSATSVSLLAANAARRAVVITNDGTKILYIAFAATATVAAFTYKLGSGATIELPLNGYTGVISGIWSAVNGNARITEITT